MNAYTYVCIKIQDKPYCALFYAERETKTIVYASDKKNLGTNRFYTSVFLSIFCLSVSNFANSFGIRAHFGQVDVKTQFYSFGNLLILKASELDLQPVAPDT